MSDLTAQDLTALGSSIMPTVLPPDVRAAGAKGEQLYKGGDFAGAAEAMNLALALGTQDAHLLYHAGLIFSRAGDLEHGRVLLKQTVAINPYYNAFHVHR